MKENVQKMMVRWLYLAVGVLTMLFAGIIYAWSILKAPFTDEFGWTPSELALNFTLTMCFFCLGGLLGARLSRRFGIRPAMVLAGILGGGGFVLTSILDGSAVFQLYLTYGLMAGLGIGIVYNVVVATVNPWFPDKKGLCSGCLMMGFGASALVLGNLAAAMFGSALGWRGTYRLLGMVLGLVLIGASFILKQLDPVSQPQKKEDGHRQSEEQMDYTWQEMLRRPSFWMAFLCIVFLSAVGSSVISFARDLALSVNASTALATTLVGVLSICNGLGRIITGAVFDMLGCRRTMIVGNLLTMVAAGVTLGAVTVGSLPLCIAGLCLTGLSYGCCPTITAAFTSSFYGMKHFSTNVAIMTFNVMGGSLIATLSSTLLASSGGYITPFLMLLVLTAAALVLNLGIRRP